MSKPGPKSGSVASYMTRFWAFRNAASRDLGIGAVGRGFFHSLSASVPNPRVKLAQNAHLLSCKFRFFVPEFHDLWCLVMGHNLYFCIYLYMLTDDNSIGSFSPRPVRRCPSCFGGVTDLLLQAAVRSWDNQSFAIQVPTIHRLATNL